MLRRIRQLTGTTGEREVSLTPRSEKAIQKACLEARQLDHAYVDTRHLLLGLSRESEGGAAQILSDLDVGYEDVRRGFSETHATEE